MEWFSAFAYCTTGGHQGLIANNENATRMGGVF
jgi:hypothetical protein